MPLATSRKRTLKAILVACCMGIILNILCNDGDDFVSRRMSVSFPGGCEFGLPKTDIPDSIDWDKTIIVEYPSVDKSSTSFMEALTGWASKDEWEFEFIGTSNHPFITTNYPSQEGIWSWDGKKNRVISTIFISAFSKSF